MARCRAIPIVEPTGWTTVACPDCGAHAEIESRAHMSSTQGWVEHLKIRCLYGHWFFMPAEMLDIAAGP
jgi:hypothetical protein